ncbi:hypothetical protein H0264_30290 [Nocardia huaxiensis]|uniref:Mce-associated membrane protein n=1 Tax=Nocardia huaxiensis TaxID=2755382 RepID=A0A7D6ZG45_9NOCA|nr:hypothetical protein [Nocardia huaxiensis]QLY29507.1 hypothetical protein H0264_30290 [Nocardia huaxiensis]
MIDINETVRTVRMPVVVAAVTLAALLALGLFIAAGYFASERSDLASTATARQATTADHDAALKAGSEFLAVAYTVDAVNDKGMSKWNTAMTAATTDTLKEQVRDTKAMLSLLTEAGASMTGTVGEAAVVSQNDTLIRMIAVVQLTGKAPEQVEPTTGSVTEYVDLMKIDGTWKVFGYKDITAKTGAGDTAAGLPGLPATQPAK